MYVLGIDGGGTKTKGVIADHDGNIVATTTVGPSNPNNVRRSDLQKELSTLFKKLEEQSGLIHTEINSVVAGMSGVDHPVARQEMHEIIKSLLPKTVKSVVTNDAITALYSGTFGQPGIVQIAGTGSITYGLNNNGDVARVGGWGYLIGEKGSGYAIGNDGLVAAFRDHDGLAEPTMINQLIKEHFKISSLPSIIHTIYQSPNVKETIAVLSKIVVSAYDSGDKIAQQIIIENGNFIGKSIACLIKRIFTETDIQTNIPVVLVGGLFNRFDILQTPILNQLKQEDISAKLIIPQIEPVGGAVIAALKEEGVTISENFVKNFKKVVGNG
ncbi:N-acetylglucosamine kinase [Bacillus kwashiorkori]|uniref:N-acetylglucosamine kinase n=1 Tax=Bacillus kwashiorkori TaxID=1522318 RepID=UPI000783C6AA|nr:BadF/BadG/BcrA/BcrD ATPase family protein [Bacillus kwashiorkori]